MKALIILFPVLSCVQPSTLFALEAKPLELTILDKEYCEFGLSRPKPHKWCICWGKITTAVEVMPWDCVTRAPNTMRLRRDPSPNWEWRDISRDFNLKGNILSPKAEVELIADDLQKRLESLLEKAFVFLFNKIAESPNGDSLLEEELKQLLVPYFRSYFEPSYVKPSLTSQVWSALKILLLEINSLSMNELERLATEIKGFIVKTLEELLLILKDSPAMSTTERVTTRSRDPFWDYVEKIYPVPEKQKLESVANDGSALKTVRNASTTLDNSKLPKLTATISPGNSSKFVWTIINRAIAAQIAALLNPTTRTISGQAAGLISSPDSFRVAMEKRIPHPGWDAEPDWKNEGSSPGSHWATIATESRLGALKHTESSIARESMLDELERDKVSMVGKSSLEETKDAEKSSLERDKDWRHEDSLVKTSHRATIATESPLQASERNKSTIAGVSFLDESERDKVSIAGESALEHSKPSIARELPLKLDKPSKSISDILNGVTALIHNSATLLQQLNSPFSQPENFRSEDLQYTQRTVNPVKEDLAKSSFQQNGSVLVNVTTHSTTLVDQNPQANTAEKLDQTPESFTSPQVIKSENSTSEAIKSSQLGGAEEHEDPSQASTNTTPTKPGYP